MIRRRAKSSSFRAQVGRVYFCRHQDVPSRLQRLLRGLQRLVRQGKDPLLQAAAACVGIVDVRRDPTACQVQFVPLCSSFAE